MRGPSLVSSSWFLAKFIAELALYVPKKVRVVLISKFGKQKLPSFKTVHFFTSIWFSLGGGVPHAQAPRPDGPSSWTANINHDEKIGSHLAAIRPALIFSWIEAPDPFQTKIFFPESSTNTSPWFIDDHAMSTWRGNNSEFTPSLQCLRLRKKSLQCHLSHNRSRTASNLEKRGRSSHPWPDRTPCHPSWSWSRLGTDPWSAPGN